MENVNAEIINLMSCFDVLLLEMYRYFVFACVKHENLNAFNNTSLLSLI